jgi:hypothetical protein
MKSTSTEPSKNQLHIDFRIGGKTVAVATIVWDLVILQVELSMERGIS